MNINRFKNFLTRQNVMIITVTAVVTIVGFLFVINRGNNSTENISTYTIDNQILQQSINQRKRFFESNNQTVEIETLENDARTRLLNELIIREYASDNDITITDKRLNDYYQARIKQYDSEVELLAEIERLYGMNKQQYKESLEYDLLREAVQKKLDTSLAEWLSNKRSKSKLIITD